MAAVIVVALIIVVHAFISICEGNTSAASVTILSACTFGGFAMYFGYQLFGPTGVVVAAIAGCLVSGLLSLIVEGSTVAGEDHEDSASYGEDWDA